MTPRKVAAFALALATLGVAIPYGTASGGGDPTVATLEWVLSALALVSGLGLLADLVPHINPSAYARGLAFMVAGGTWAVIAAYQFTVLGDFTIWWRIGHAVPSLAWAVLGLTAWRLVIVERRRDRAAEVSHD